MKPQASGKHLFIVDNSAKGWTGLRYLEEWTAIAGAFDIATGFFEIGALLALDGKWQQLEKIRILMGGETTQRTRRLSYGNLQMDASDGEVIYHMAIYLEGGALSTAMVDHMVAAISTVDSTFPGLTAVAFAGRGPRGLHA